MDIGLIIICVIAGIAVLVLFFVADYMTKNSGSSQSKPKAEAKAQKEEPASKKDAAVEPKQEKVASIKLADPHGGLYNDRMTEVEYTMDLNSNNLANDLQQLMVSDGKNDSHLSGRIMASQRTNTGRMRDYHAQKSAAYAEKYRGFGISEEDEISGGFNEYSRASEGNVQVGNMSLTEEEMKKMIVEVINRKQWD